MKLILLIALTWLSFCCGGPTICPPTWGAQCTAPLVGKYDVDIYVPPYWLFTKPDALVGTATVVDQQPHGVEEAVMRTRSDLAGTFRLSDGRTGSFTGSVNEETQCVLLDFKVQLAERAIGTWHWQGAIDSSDAGKLRLNFWRTGNADADRCHNGIAGVAYGTPEAYATKL